MSDNRMCWNRDCIFLPMISILFVYLHEQSQKELMILRKAVQTHMCLRFSWDRTGPYIDKTIVIASNSLYGII